MFEERHNKLRVRVFPDNGWADIEVFTYPDGSSRNTFNSPDELRKFAEVIDRMADEWEKDEE